MPKFPNLESEVVALAQNMIAGYTAHAADFPGTDATDLTVVMNAYLNAKNAQEQAKGSALVATESKNGQLTTLIQMMKNDLKVSEADVSSDPEKLAYIGWGPKAPPTPIIAPEAPTDLRASYDGVPGEVTLMWKKPAAGGPVRNYIIQRRDQDAAAVFGPWRMLDFAYDTTVSFVDQPQGVRMEYRVMASNAAGESAASNVAPVVL